VKMALITGITGQDGSYLAEFLLSKGYEVHGLIRCASTFNTTRIDHMYVDPHSPNARLSMHYGDLANLESLTDAIYNIQPDEIYHLGAQPHVRVGFHMPEYTGDITWHGILFNHESPPQGETFATCKITRALANIPAEKQDKLYPGNLKAKRDRRYPAEYVEVMWKIIQRKKDEIESLFVQMFT